MKKIFLVETLSFYQFEHSLETKVFRYYDDALSYFNNEVKKADEIAGDAEIHRNEDEGQVQDDYIAYTTANGNDKEYVIYKTGYFVENSMIVSIKEKEVLDQLTPEDLTNGKDTTMTEEETEDDVELPTVLRLFPSDLQLDADDQVDNEEDINDIISDYLSNTFGYCHKGFRTKIEYGYSDTGAKYLDYIDVYDIIWDFSE